MKLYKKILLAAGLMMAVAPGIGFAHDDAEVIDFGSRLPQNASEVHPCDNPYDVAAFAVAAFIRYTENPAEGEAMLNVLKGPEPLNPFGKQFLRERLRGKEYVARSYILGTSPENKYTLQAPYQVAVFRNPYSFKEDNIARLLLASSGADSQRPIVLRKKPSTGQWFLWTYEGILADIRQPEGASSWD